MSKIDLPHLPVPSNQKVAKGSAAFDFALYETLKQFTLEGKTDVSSFLLASFAILLERYSRQSDLVIGLDQGAVKFFIDPEKSLQAQQPSQGENLKPTIFFQTSLSMSPSAELVLVTTQKEKSIEIALHAPPSRFSMEFLQNMALNYVELIKGLIKNFDDPVGSIPIVNKSEYAHILQMGQGELRAYPQDQSVPDLFEVMAKKYGKRIAVSCNGKTLTYEELNSQANRLARYLIDLGVKKGDFVAISLTRSIDLVRGLIAILKTGAAYLPIDATYPLERKHYMIEDGQVSLLLTQTSEKDHFPLKNLNIVCLDMIEAKISHYSSDNLQIEISPSDHANILYTSGSTGRPKGVELCHQGIVRLVCNSNWFKITPDDRMIMIANTSFDGMTQEVWGPLLNGASIAIYGKKQLSPHEMAEFLVKENVTHAVFTARFFNLLVEHEISSLKKLRLIGSVGEAMSVAHAKSAFTSLPECKVINGYGPTENSFLTTALEVKSLEEIDQTVPIGPPIANTTVYVLNPFYQLCPIGVQGELYTGGDGVAKGYLRRPELTQEKFIPNPFGEGHLYRTGDLVRLLPSGSFDFSGRLDFQVKIRGFRIELGEIQEALRKHPKIADCFVMAREDVPGEKRIVGYAEPIPNETVSAEELKAFLSSKLIDYMVPSFIVVMDELPVTPNGKIDQRALPAPHSETEAKAALTGNTEKLLGEMWSELLGFSNIGPEDNFFQLGGDSIHVMQLSSRLKKRLQKEIPTAAIFQNPLLKQLAIWIDQNAKELAAEEVIAPREHHSPSPLSKNQESIWLAHELNPSQSAYFIDFAFKIQGNLNISVLKEALERVIQRHEILRTTFTEKQHIHSDCPKVFHFHQMGEKEADQFLKEKSQPHFQLNQLPLLHFYLIEVGSNDYRALFQIHHIIFDGWSIELFFREWEAYYQGLIKQAPLQKAPLPFQYADYALWQLEFLKSEKCRHQLSYWKTKLSDAPELLELPWDFPRPAVFSNRGALHRFALKSDLSQRLKQLAKSNNVTLFELLYTAFNVFLYRISGKSDIVVGTPYANRSRNHLDEQIGYYVQMLMTRTDLTDNPPFLKLISRLSSDLAEAYLNGDVPIDLIVAAVQHSRNSSYSPIFQVSFSLEKPSKKGLYFPDCETTPLFLETKVARFDISLIMSESENGLEGIVEYSTDLFLPSTLQRMMGNFQTLLEGICQNPTMNIAYLPILSQAEKHQLLNEWNQTKTSYPALSIPLQFEAMCQKYRDKTAIIGENIKISYDQLDQRSNQFARYLRRKGVKKGDFIGVSIPRSVELIVAILGIFKAEASSVPIDASYPLDRKQFMAEEAGLTILVTQNSEKDQFSLKNLHLLLIDQEKSLIDKEENGKLSISSQNSDTATLLFTSGSTGKPKGVPISHRGVVRLVCNNEKVPFTPEDRVLQTSNVSFDAMLFEVWGALLNGATLCIYLQKDFLPEELGSFLAKYHVTVALLTAAALNIMVEQQLHQLKSLRYFYSGGEAMSATHAKIAFENLPNCAIGNAYGPTENSVISTLFFIDDLADLQNSVPIGTPISNTTVYILDSHQQLIPIGVHGELCTGGDGLTIGYLNRPELTAEKFIDNPFGKGKLYRTGDLVRYREDGNIDFLGRIDSQVKIRGFRIEVGEIEEVLRGMEAISDCIVLAREDSPGNKRLVAYLESDPRKSLKTSTVRDYISSKLPPHMIPSFFVVLEKLPLTPNGKIDRKALPAPDAITEPQPASESPKTPLEQIIANTWMALLNCGSVGRKDNFFMIGGHSIAAARLASVLGKTLNTTIPVGLVFEDSTLEKYAKKIEQLMEPEMSEKKFVTTSELFWIWRNKEARLDPEIGIPKGAAPTLEQYTAPKKILLTGATGFVGAFMLKELLDETSAQIFVLLRAKDPKQALERIQSTLEPFKLWDPSHISRITPLCGDLEKPLLGLSNEQFDELAQEIDSIFHVGALVNHALPYHKMKAANVLGTQEALRLACKGKVKPFHFVSTAAVFEMTGDKKIAEDDDLNQAKNLFNGYGQSKWVAEKLVMIARSRGLPANIYRLARVAGHSKTGACQTGDFLWRMAEASLFLNLAPDIGYQENITPVDFICKAIRAISTTPAHMNHEYHVLNPQLYAYRDIFKTFQSLGYRLDFVPYTEWRQTLVKTSMEAAGDRLKAIVPLFSEMDMSHTDENVELKSDRLQKTLQPMQITCPTCDEKLIKTYIDYFRSIGFFPNS